MNHLARNSAMRHSLLLILLGVLTFGGSAQGQSVQEESAKKALTVDDYSRWRSISNSAISGDGTWVTFVLRQTNTKQEDSNPVLHVLNLETQEDLEVLGGSAGTFSEDSRWIAYQVDPRNRPGGRQAGGGEGETDEEETEDSEEGGDEDEEEERRRVELRNLETGDVRSWVNVQSLEFSKRSSHLVLRRRSGGNAGGGGGRGGSGGQGGGGGSDTGEAPRGVDVVVHDLGTGHDLLLGSVSDFSFNRDGDLLAFTVDAAGQDANGLSLLELESGRMHVLDNDAKRYARLTWNDAGSALAVLKGSTAEGKRERENELVVFPDVRAAVDQGATASKVILDPTAQEGFPEGWVVSDRASVTWSADDTRVFFGSKKQVEEPEAREEDTDEVANVDVWNTVDERIQSLQMRRANSDRNLTYRQAFEIGSGEYVGLADETMRDLDVAPEGRWAVGRDPTGYIHDVNPSAADIYRVDTRTGERTLMLSNQPTRGLLGFSADGQFFLVWKDELIQAYDLDAGTFRTLGGNTAPSFVNVEDDHFGPRPTYGISGFTADGSSVVARTRYDLWVLPLDGSDAWNLTNGHGDDQEIRFRYVDLDPEDPPAGRGGSGPRKIDLSEPLTLTAYGQWTKKSGFFELSEGELDEIVFEDARFSTPTKAKNSDRYLFSRQTFVEYPDLRVSGPDFSSSEKITDANPQQAEFLWGHRVLFDYENKDGMRLQGILGIPDDYQQGEKRPMLVTFYEKNSQNLHRYSSPSYLGGMGSSPIQAVSEGTLTMLPDIHFRTRTSHSDMLESIEAAVEKVIEMGYADPERIGVTGHSYGGQGAAFVGVRSKMFAAVGMGAGVTHLHADFNQNWGWTYEIDGGSGNNGHNYYIHGQGRQATNPWEDPELYLFESAISHAPDAEAPFLIMHGTADPTVAFQNGLGFYNALRFNGKRAVLLAYPGEGHGLRGLANRKDLTVRFFEFFNHFLKDEPAPDWWTKGVPFLEKNRG